MNPAQNPPRAIEAAPTSSPDVESSQKASENTSPAVEATTSVTVTQLNSVAEVAALKFVGRLSPKLSAPEPYGMLTGSS
jgi:hypothetical protein